jgi:hypothetical protein
MKALATLKNVDSDSTKKTIVRNLSRILDIRIIDIDIENGILCFLHTGQKAFDQVKKELGRIGHPIQNYTDQFPKKKDNGTPGNLHVSTSRARRPYCAINL